MDFINDRQFWWRIKWQWAVLIVFIAGITIGLIGRIFGLFEPLTSLSAALIFLSEALFLVSAAVFAFAMLLLCYEICKMLRENTDKLNTVSNSLEEQKRLLKTIDRGVRMSEIAKQIAYRDADWEGLRDTVVDKLHKKDFDLTYTLIDNIAKRDAYKELADQLRTQADAFKNANEDERASQVITYVERLMDKHQWVRASDQIERLINAFPHSEKAQKMPAILSERKDMRKKELLAEWDESIKRQDTDKSLTILKELDLYLTPSEGLALQESAKDAFRTKLHNLGVRFSMEVADKNWDEAISTGQAIMKEFPNSRMAAEIRTKMSVLKDLANK